MSDTGKPKPAAPPAQSSPDKVRKNKDYDQQVEGTFPASDPPADSEPGGGITGPEPTRERGERR